MGVRARLWLGQNPTCISGDNPPPTLWLHYVYKLFDIVVGKAIKRTVGRQGLHPGHRWGSFQRSPRPPTWCGGRSLRPCPITSSPTPLRMNCFQSVWLPDTMFSNIQQSKLHNAFSSTDLQPELIHLYVQILLTKSAYDVHATFARGRGEFRRV